jgi:hypothetical protein
MEQLRLRHLAVVLILEKCVLLVIIDGDIE